MLDLSQTRATNRHKQCIECPYCKTPIGRIDSLKRHLKRFKCSAGHDDQPLLETNVQKKDKVKQLYHCKGPDCLEYIAHNWYYHVKKAHAHEDEESIAEYIYQCIDPCESCKKNPGK